MAIGWLAVLQSVRVLWLSAATAVAAIAVLLGLFLAFSRLGA